jgi:hypothetical protein
VKKKASGKKEKPRPVRVKRPAAKPAKTQPILPLPAAWER